MWSVKTSAGTSKYTNKELVDLLFNKLMANPEKEDQQLFINKALEALSQHLSDSTFRVLFTTAFRLGYIYRIFMEKNDVTFESNSAQDTEFSSVSS
jgi:hypothetical protein